MKVFFDLEGQEPLHVAQEGVFHVDASSNPAHLIDSCQTDTPAQVGEGGWSCYSRDIGTCPKLRTGT